MINCCENNISIHINDDTLNRDKKKKLRNNSSNKNGTHAIRNISNPHQQLAKQPSLINHILAGMTASKRCLKINLKKMTYLIFSFNCTILQDVKEATFLSNITSIQQVNNICNCLLIFTLYSNLDACQVSQTYALSPSTFLFS